MELNSRLGRIYSRRVVRRLASNSNRNDFLTTLVRKVEEGQVTKEEADCARINASVRHLPTGYLPPSPNNIDTLARLAGVETVSTFLAAATFYPCKKPETLRRLRSEVRSTFDEYEEIDATSAISAGSDTGGNCASIPRDRRGSRVSLQGLVCGRDVDTCRGSVERERAPPSEPGKVAEKLTLCYG